MTNKKVVSIDPNLRLVRALGEELKLPLLQIARASELAQKKGDLSSLSEIEATANAALRLVDNYLFSTQILLSQRALDLQPVSVPAALYDTAQYMRRLGKLYDCDIDVKLQGRLNLVMASPEALQAALTSLAYSLVNTSNGKRSKIILQAQKTGDTVTAKVISNQTRIAKDSLTNARELFGLARRPLSGVTHANGAGVYVADSLFAAMYSELKVCKLARSSGFMASLLPSHQLALPIG